MSKCIRVKDIAQYEDTDSELAKFTITSLCMENNQLKYENLQLKKLCDKYEEEHRTVFKIWKEHTQKNIDDAIKYIEENKEETDCCGETYINLGEIEIEELLKILKR